MFRQEIKARLLRRLVQKIFQVLKLVQKIDSYELSHQRYISELNKVCVKFHLSIISEYGIHPFPSFLRDLGYNEAEIAGFGPSVHIYYYYLEYQNTKPIYSNELQSALRKLPNVVLLRMNKMKL